MDEPLVPHLPPHTASVSRGNINHPNVGSYGDRDDETREELEGQVAKTMSATGKNGQHLLTLMSVEPWILTAHKLTRSLHIDLIVVVVSQIHT